jgi:hypothetical protein
MKTLEQTAQDAGLKDMDLLKLVGQDVPPALAISNLRDRYPGAFAKPIRDMTPAEFKAAEAKFLQPAPRAPLPDNLRKHVDDMTLAEKEAFERYHGIQVGGDERRRRAGVRAEQQRRQEMGL